MVCGALLIELMAAFFGACHMRCSATTCAGKALFYPVVSVVDATTGQPICDATVVVLSGDAASQPLPVRAENDGGTTNCTYRWDAYGYAGTFALRISKAGYQSATANDVEVRSEACGGSSSGVAPQMVHVSLEPDG